MNSVDYSGLSALHLASGKGHTALVLRLVMLGANALAKDDWGRTAADHATHYGHGDVAEILSRAASSDPNLQHTGPLSPRPLSPRKRLRDDDSAVAGALSTIFATWLLCAWLAVGGESTLSSAKWEFHTIHLEKRLEKRKISERIFVALHKSIA